MPCRHGKEHSSSFLCVHIAYGIIMSPPPPRNNIKCPHFCTQPTLEFFSLRFSSLIRVKGAIATSVDQYTSLRGIEW